MGFEVEEAGDGAVALERLSHTPAPDAVLCERILVNLLHNAVRHGAPSRCTVSLGWRNGQAILRVEDDGIGIHRVVPGHGLRTMRERVEELGGKLTVRPAAPRGTVVTAVIPGFP